MVELGTDIAILCIYRSPSNAKTDLFTSTLNDILPTFSHFKSVVLTGDINLDIKPLNLDTRSQDYLNVLAFHGFLPAHTLPTRGPNCLDHIILKSKSPSISLVFDTTTTDHNSSLLGLHVKKTKVNINNTISKIDFDKLDKSMEEMDLSPIYSILDANIAAETLVNVMSGAISANTRVIKLPARKKILKPWITPGLLRCMKHRDLLHKNVKKFPDNNILVISYKRYRNFCNRILKKVKRQFDTEELSKAGNNSKVLWEKIKRITHTSKTQNSSAQLISQVDSPTQSCNAINSFFAEIGKNLANKITHNRTLFQQTIAKSTLSTSFVLDETDPIEIISIINSLRANAATGWDGISPVILKRYSSILAPVLNHIFNLCFQTATFPSPFKKAVIHPVFKSGDKESVNNYRPIAVLTALSKVLERLINKRLVSYFDKFNVISPQQFGFRKNKSTTDAVQELTGYIVNKLNSHKKVLTIFLDLAKAFDTIPIPILLNKLDQLGIRGLQLQFFQSYLTNRTQMVKVGDHTSSELPICYGVPQGSILGPTLFLAFINDLCNLPISNAKIVSFADDTALTFSADSWMELQNLAQDGFNSAYNWLLSHTLTLNTSKTKLITFSLTSKSQPKTPILIKAHSCQTFSQISLPCQCPPITPVDNIRYLGITIDKFLNYKTHVNLLTGRVRKLIYVFKNLRHVANSTIIRSVYHALCQSIVTYCITCWGGALKTTLKPLEIAHRAILKVASFKPISYPTTTLYKNWNVLNVRQHFILQTVILQHRQTPFTTILKRRKDSICTIPRPSFSFTKRFFYYLGPYLYNRLNACLLIYGLTYLKCKSTVRSFLLSKSYDETEALLKFLI